MGVGDGDTRSGSAAAVPAVPATVRGGRERRVGPAKGRGPAQARPSDAAAAAEGTVGDGARAVDGHEPRALRAADSLPLRREAVAGGHIVGMSVRDLREGYLTVGARTRGRRGSSRRGSGATGTGGGSCSGL